MPTVLARVKLAHVTLLDRDADDMTFVFDGEQTSALALANDIDGAHGGTGALQAFFNVNGGGFFNVAHYIGNCISRASNDCSIEYYDITAHLDGSAHGSPIKITRFTMGAALAGSTDLPAEISAVLTMHGSLWATAPVEGPVVGTIPTDARAQREGAPATHSGRTRPRSRHSGRVYVGPLIKDSVGMIANEARLTNAVTGDIITNAAALKADVSAITVDTTWDVWSRRNASTDEIVGGFIDNAPDVQRRRGVKSSLKQLWS